MTTEALERDAQEAIRTQSGGANEPLRLLAIVQAPRARIEAIIARNPVLQNLFGNGWVALAARDAPEAPWMRHTHDGFVPWTDKERLLDAP